MADALFPLQESFARQFAQEWIAAWNNHDLERILGHYDEEVTLISPVAIKIAGTGTVQGKEALRKYFSRGLQAYPDPRFDLIDVFWGIETVVLYYGSSFRESKTAEVMEFGASGKVRRVWANYNQ